MAASLAGARNLDERRGRRQSAGKDDAKDSSPRSQGRTRRGSEAASRPITHFPLRKLISPRPWKHYCLGFAALVVGLGLLAAAWVAALVNLNPIARHLAAQTA